MPRAKTKPAPGREKIQITPSFDSDRLAAAFDGDDSSFTETITGIVASISEKFSSRKEKAADPAPTPTADTVGTGESPFGGSKILGIGAVAVAAVIAIGVWTFVGFDDTAPPEATGRGANPVREAPAISETRPDAGAQDGITSSEIDLALANAEAAMLARRSDDATAALDRVAEADPNNARLPFLLAQLSQMKLREYLENARAAIRESRLEDAAIALGGARALDVSDTFEIDSVAEVLAAARNEQRVEDVLAQAADRLEQGKLLSPANDNAGYFYERALATDPDNAAAQQGLNIIAGKLVLQARTEIDENRFDNATNLLNDARGLDPSSEELAAASRALTDAQDRIADENFRKEAALLAAAKLAEDKRIAAERKATADRVAAAQRKEEARLAAERKAEADRIAVAQRKEDERLAAERKAEADRQAEVDRVAAAQRKEDERLAVERKSEADRQAEADRVAAAQREENESLAAAALLSANKNATAAASGSLRNRNVVAASVGPERLPVQEKPEEIVGVSSLTRVKYVAPKYPRAAERKGLSGWVDVVFTVATDGSTKNIDVPNSEPGEMFVKSAIRAVEKWQFMPVFDNGTVVERRAGVRMMFAIE